VAVSGRDLDPYFAAAVEATEEAVITSLLAATTVVGRDGNTSRGLPFDEVARLVAESAGDRG
jgi:D-aminopeptidase